MGLEMLAMIALALLVLLQVLSAVLVIVRLRRPPRHLASRPMPASATVIVPVAGLTAGEVETALAALQLAGPRVEVLYCAVDPSDPATRAIGERLAQTPVSDPSARHARLLVGRSRISDNPKMDNIEKAAGTTAEMLVFLDGNLLATPDLFERLLAVWDEKTGLVSSPPLATQPLNFAAELECAFLNTLFLRWQYVGDAFRLAYTQGKLFAMPRALFDAGGGMAALFANTAEDAAATWLVRRAGLRVCLTTHPFEQPLGRRRFGEVWRRNLRWAQLRRHAYPIVYLSEPLITSVPALVLALTLALSCGWSVPGTLAGVMIPWYGSEYLLARAAGWPASARMAIAYPLRDAMLLAIWCRGWFGRRYSWRGTTIEMRASPAGEPPVASAPRTADR